MVNIPMEEEKEKIKKLYYSKNFEELFKLVGNNRKKRIFLRNLICEKRKKFAEEFRRNFRATGNLLEDILQIYKAYFNIEIPKDGKIVKETENEVIIDWFNYCPVLEALKKLNIDSRSFCKEVYEKPVQVLLDSLLPYKVKFTRDYNYIRPYAKACREIFRRVS